MSGKTAMSPGQEMTGEQELGMWPPARCINISQSQCHGLNPAVSTLKNLVREHERPWVTGGCWKVQFKHKNVL